MHDAGHISLPTFTQAFGFRPPPWDWAERTADTLGRTLFATVGAESAAEVAEALESTVARRPELTEATFRSAVEAVAGTTAVGRLRLRPMQWPSLFKFLDEDSADGVLGAKDIERWLGHLAPVRRVMAEVGDILYMQKLSVAEVFRRVDADGSGWIDEEEFAEALSLLRPRGTAAEATVLWRHIARRKPQLGFEQFCAALREPPLAVGWQDAAQSALRLRIKSKPPPATPAAIFDAMCAGGGAAGPGLLSSLGWRRSVQRLGLGLSARQCDELFRAVDANGDSVVDIHELMAWLNSEQGQPLPAAGSSPETASRPCPRSSTLLRDRR